MVTGSRGSSDPCRELKVAKTAKLVSGLPMSRTQTSFKVKMSKVKVIGLITTETKSVSSIEREDLRSYELQSLQIGTPMELAQVPRPDIGPK